MVLERSLAEMPVVTPSPAKSTETVNGVWCKEVLSFTIKGSPSSSQRSSTKGAQINPRPWVAIKLTISGLMFRAAVIKSPSFSRSSSSTTTITLPLRKSSRASSMLLNVNSLMLLIACRKYTQSNCIVTAFFAIRY